MADLKKIREKIAAGLYSISDHAIIEAQKDGTYERNQATSMSRMSPYDGTSGHQPAL